MSISNPAGQLCQTNSLRGTLKTLLDGGLLDGGIMETLQSPGQDAFDLDRQKL